MFRRERRKLDAPGEEIRIAGHEEGVGPLADQGCKSRFDLAAGAGVEVLNLQSNGASSFRYLSLRGLRGVGIGRIDQHGNPNGFGHEVMQ